LQVATQQGVRPLVAFSHCVPARRIKMQQVV
jgi:hypothetical protein